MRNVLFGIGLLVGVSALFVGGVGAAMYAEERLNYDPVPAQVTSVEPFCVIETRRARSSVSESGPMPCAEATRLHRPGDGDRKIERLRMTFRYISPVDRAAQKATIDTLPDLYPNVRAGDEVTVLAHTREPERTAQKLF